MGVDRPLDIPADQRKTILSLLNKHHCLGTHRGGAGFLLALQTRPRFPRTSDVFPPGKL